MAPPFTVARKPLPDAARNLSTDLASPSLTNPAPGSSSSQIATSQNKKAERGRESTTGLAPRNGGKASTRAPRGTGDVEDRAGLGMEMERLSATHAFPMLAEHEMKALSEPTRQAYQRLVSLGPDATEDEQTQAMLDWVTEAAADLRVATGGPSRYTLTTAKNTAVNALTQFLGNSMTFTLATLVSGGAGKAAGLAPHQVNAINAGVIALMQAFGSDLPSYVGRKMGGTEMQLRMSFGNHGKNGQYIKMAGNLALAMTAVTFHGLTNVAVSSGLPALHDSWGGRVGRSVLSGVGMTAGTQMVTATGSKITEHRLALRNGEARHAPEDQHTRSEDSISFKPYSYAPLSERASHGLKPMEVVLRTVAAIAGSLLQFGLQQEINDRLPVHTHPKANSAASILGTYSAMFLVMHAVSVLGTYMFMDTKRHIARYGKVGNDLLVKQIQDSSNKGKKTLIANASVAMEKGLLGDELGAEMRDCVEVLNGHAFREAVNSKESDPQRSRALTDRITGVQERLAALAEHVESLSGLEPATGSGSHLADGTFGKIARNLQTASDDIELATRNYVQRENGALYPELSDAAHRIRDTADMLMEIVTKYGGAEHALADPRTMEVAQALLSTFCAVDKVDRAGVAKGVLDKIVEAAREQDRADHRGAVKQGAAAVFDNSPKELLDAMSGILAKRGVAEEVVAVVHRVRDPQETEAVVQTLDRLLTDNLQGNLAALAGAVMPGRQSATGKSLQSLPDWQPLVQDDGAVRILMLENLLTSDRGDGADKAAQLERLGQHIARFNGLGVEGRPSTAAPEVAARKSALKAFLQDFKSGEFTLEQVHQHVLVKLDRATPDELATLENGDQDSALDHRGAAVFAELLGDKFVSSATQEHSPPSDSTAAELGEQLVRQLERDMAAKPASRKEAIEAALSLPAHRFIPGVPMHYQKDVHAHLTNYNGVITSMARQALMNKANRVEMQLNAAIPHQVPNSSAEKKYYASINRLMDYVNRDYALAAAWLQMSNVQQMRVLELTVQYSNDPARNIEVTSTGGDPTDVNSQKRETAHLERAFRDTGVPIRMVGETTLDKEQVKLLTPRRIRVENESSVATLNSSFDAGKVFLMHADGGSSHLAKGSNDGSLDQLFRDLMTTQRFPSVDPIRSQPGLEGEAQRYDMAIHAHGPGMAKTISERPDHCKFIHNRMKEANAAFKGKGEVNVDLSWDFIAMAALENTHDILKDGNYSQDLGQSVQNLLKTYRSFENLGGPSDKADDIGVVDQASEWRVGSDRAAELHFQALSSFASVAKREFADPAKRTRLLAMMKENPADSVKGNNWFGFAYHNQDHLLYGSDTLAPGIKAHGQNAYALNVRMLEFMYVMFDEAAKYDADFGGVADKIASGNFTRVFEHQGLEDRRQSYSRHTREGQSEWGSTPIRPDVVIQPLDGLPNRLLASGKSTAVDGGRGGLFRERR